MIGRMHGEKTDMIPAKNAMRIVVCMVVVSSPLTGRVTRFAGCNSTIPGKISFSI